MSTEITDTDTEGETAYDGTTGWETLAGKPGVVRIVDALLDLPPGDQFNKRELADIADVSRNTVGEHADLLVDAGVIEEVEYANSRYRANTDSDVFELLYELDAAVGRRLHADSDEE
ncbi:MAG: winged helix-turn-helix domain-containing protein [Halobaculum sp.]